MSSRALVALAILLLGIPLLHAAPDCPVPAHAPRATGQIKDWYDTYLKPFRVLAGIQEDATLTLEQIAVLIEKQDAYNRRSSRDPLFFEPLVQQVTQHYARAPDFKGLDMQAAGKIYQPALGQKLDFSLLCLDTRTIQSRDDAFAITLFGINHENCQHIGLRGLVFTDILVNGAANGQCRPDHVYYKMLVFSINAGTNTATFLCRKDGSIGCLRQ